MRIRLESVKLHENSTEHCDSVALRVICEVSSDVGNMLTKPKEISKENMVKAFQCLYFLAKNNIPHTTNFENLLDLLSWGYR